MAPGNSRKARAARRRKRRMDRVEHDLTDDQWSALKAAWGGCAYCGDDAAALQRDCILAISRGGRYTAANVVPACRSCNASKCNEEVTAWMRRRRLEERTFLLRHHEISTALTAADDQVDDESDDEIGDDVDDDSDDERHHGVDDQENRVIGGA